MSSGLKECDDDNGGEHQADDRGEEYADNLDGATVFIVVKSQSLEDGREAVAHMEPNDDEEDEICDGDMGDLKLCPSLLIEIEVAVNPSEFDEEEVREMQQEASQKQDSRPDLQLGARVGLGALRLVIALRSCLLVGDGQPKRQDDVEQQDGQQDDLKDFHDVVGAHEVTEGIVPRAAVITQDAQVGRGVEQKEDAQESA